METEKEILPHMPAAIRDEKYMKLYCLSISASISLFLNEQQGYLIALGI